MIMLLQKLLSWKANSNVVKHLSSNLNNGTYPIRSLFFTKKTRAALEKVGSLQADIVILDLEDSIENGEKANVRNLYKNALKDKIFGQSKVFIRSSSLLCFKDVEEDFNTFIGTEIEGFVIPKLNHERELIEVDEQISTIEKEKGIPAMQIKLLPLIETVSAYFTLEKIAVASRRNIGIIGGSGDFTAEAVCSDHSETYDTYFSKILLAAKLAGIAPLWGVYDKIDDHAGFYIFNRKMKRNGFVGTLALTPKQIAMANVIYSLSPQESKWIESTTNNNGGIHLIQSSVQESRQMIGPPHRLKAEGMLKQYVKETPTTKQHSTTIVKPNKGLFESVKIGEVNMAPFEFKVTDGMISLWESAFLNYSSNSIFVDEKLKESYAPLTLAATLAISLSVSCFSYFARAHLGFRNIFQVRPLLAGETVRAMFRIDDVLLKKGGDGNSYAVATSKHWLVNKQNEVVLQLEKATMFHPNDCSPKSAAEKNTHALKPENSLLLKSSISATNENILPLTPLAVINSGSIIVHDTVKVMGHSEVRMLCSLLKIVNPHHHNIIRYNSTDILVPGPFVWAASNSIASIDIGEVLYEDVSSCINPNKVNLGDQIGTMTFVEKCTQLESNPNLEEFILKHVAVKNMDMDVLASSNIPLELFSQDKKPSEYEKLCIKKLPLLIHNIVCVSTRRVIRVRAGLKRAATVPHDLSSHYA